VAYRGWFKLRRALRAALVERHDLTRAAHEGGFADSAHLTRTTKHTMGVAPAAMLPPKIFLVDEG
jgi:AraC-like DNA-binding protein